MTPLLVVGSAFLVISELEELSQLGEALLWLAPEVDPPPDFEARVVQQLRSRSPRGHRGCL